MKYPSHIVAVSSLVINKQGQFLLVKTEWRGWEIPGGQVEEGEGLIPALKREIIEEAGVNIKIQKLAAIYSSIDKPSKIILDFIAEYDNGEIQESTDEVLEVKWFSKEEMLSVVEIDSMRYRIQWLLENQNKIRQASYTKNPFTILFETFI